MVKFLRSFRTSTYRVGNGSKLFGVVVWYNSSRYAADLHLGTLQVTVIKEKR